MMEIMGVYSDSAKVVECQQSFEEIKRALNDSNLSNTAKTIEIIAQGTFITTQTAEFALRKNLSAAPFINTINGVADVVKIGVHGCVQEEDWKGISIKIAKKILSHAAETLNSVANHPGCSNASIIQKMRAVFFGASVLYDVWDYVRLDRERQARILLVNNVVEINHV